MVGFDKSVSVRSGGGQTSVRHDRNKRQVIHTLIALIFIFFICMLPIRVFTLWLLYSTDEDKMSLGLEGYLILLSFSRIMLYANSAVNPIIYNVIFVKFRIACLRTLGIKKSKYRDRGSMLTRVFTQRQTFRSSCSSVRADTIYTTIQDNTVHDATQI